MEKNKDMILGPYTIRDEMGVDISVLSPEKPSRRGLLSRSDSLTAIALAKGVIYQAPKNKVITLASYKK